MRETDPVGKAWPVVTVGYRVPRTRFDGVVHSVFARACNIECDGALLTVSVARDDGPTMLSLAHVTNDLQRIFRRGEAIRCRGGLVRGASAMLDLRRAALWRAPAPRGPLPRETVSARVDGARRRLAQVRRSQTSAIDNCAMSSTADLEDACRALDVDSAHRYIERLIGRGEGLTPAGDDYLVGVRAALAALARSDDRRLRFLAICDALVEANLARTTAVSAHYLRLAAHGDFNADVLAAVDALLAETDPDRVTRALDALLAVGATSGAATLAGIVSGFGAWLDQACLFEPTP